MPRARVAAYTGAQGSSLGAALGSANGASGVTHKENAGRDAHAIDELLEELAELKELDRVRHAHAPGSAAYDAATLEVDLRSRRLMDRFRDMTERHARAADRRLIDGMEPVDARLDQPSGEGSRLN